MTDNIQRGDVIINPEHNRGNVPDRGPCSTRVSGNNNDAAEYPSFSLLVN